MTEEEKVIEEFKLTPEEIKNITNFAITLLSGNKLPSNNPIATIVGGQMGSGKSALMNYTSTEFPDAILIDNDSFRELHPRINEIKQKYPKYYRTATDQLGMGITPNIIDYFMGNNPTHAKYDIILHNTLRSNTIVNNAMSKLHDAGYIVGVRCLAVSYFESKMSQIERCETQYSTLGFCRFADSQAHKDTIVGIPKTLDYIEDSQKYDVMQVYARSEDISKPTLIYSGINPKSAFIVHYTLHKRNLDMIGNKRNGYPSAKDALENIREQDSKECMETLNKRISKIIKKGGYYIPGLDRDINELMDEMIAYKHKEFYSNERECS